MLTTVTKRVKMNSHEGVPVRRLEPDRANTRQYVGGLRPRRQRRRPTSPTTPPSPPPPSGRLIILRLRFPIPDQEVVDEFRRLGFQERSKGTRWFGPKTKQGMRLCKVLKTTGAVRKMLIVPGILPAQAAQAPPP